MLGPLPWKLSPRSSHTPNFAKLGRLLRERLCPPAHAGRLGRSHGSPQFQRRNCGVFPGQLQKTKRAPQYTYPHTTLCSTAWPPIAHVSFVKDVRGSESNCEHDSHTM